MDDEKFIEKYKKQLNEAIKVNPEIIKSFQALGEVVSNMADILSKNMKMVSEGVSNIIQSSSLDKVIAKDRKRVELLKNTDFNGYMQYYANNIKNAENLGQFGWTVSPHCSLGGEDKIIEKLKNGASEKSVSHYFFKNQNQIYSVIDELKQKYLGDDCLSLYFEDFERLFRKREYMGASFDLSSILNSRILFAFKTSDVKKITKVIEKCIEPKKEQYYNEARKNDNYHTSVFILTEFLPSFHEYANRTFIEDLTKSWSDPKNEPNYFNRNWLMHGKRTRVVEKYEVLQLLNALSCLEEIIDALQKYKILN